MKKIKDMVNTSFEIASSVKKKKKKEKIQCLLPVSVNYYKESSDC